MAKKYKLKEFEIGDIKVDGGIKSTVTDIDDATGAITWDIFQVPDIDKLLDQSDDLVQTAKGVYTKVKDDKVFLDIYKQARLLRNAIRTHTRNNYPEEYKKSRGVNEAYSGFIRGEEDPDSIPFKPTKSVSEFTEDLRALFGKFKGDLKNPEFIKGVAQVMVNWKSLLRSQLDEEDVDEVSMSGAAGAYLTPYAFRIPKKKKKKKLKEKALPLVRKKLAKVPKAKKVTSKQRMKLPSGMVSSFGYNVSEDATNSANIHKQGQHPGEDLGPGPKAGPDGVTDSAYTKQFKYKLVPKTKDGTYVQKGSGMIVKKLF